VFTILFKICQGEKRTDPKFPFLALQEKKFGFLFFSGKFILPRKFHREKKRFAAKPDGRRFQERRKMGGQEFQEWCRLVPVTIPIRVGGFPEAFLPPCHG
jgi:hypothetical protein